MLKSSEAPKIREMYPEGTSIRLINMAGEKQMPAGMTGKVLFVDDAGQIHMSWENGSHLALDTEVDSFEAIGQADIMTDMEESGPIMEGPK